MTATLNPVATTEFSLRGYLSRHRRQALKVLGWSVLVALPTAMSGRLVASAVDAAVSDNGNMVEAIGLLLMTAALGTACLRGSARAGATLTESVHEDVTRDVVAGTLAFAVDTDTPGRGGAELTEHIPVIRERLGLATFKLSSLIGALGACIGFVTISPLGAAVITPFVLLAIAGDMMLTRSIIQRQRDSMLASEHVSEGLATALESVRDITAAGAAQQVNDDLRDRIEVGRVARVRTADAVGTSFFLVDAVGSRLPALLLLAWLPFAFRHGASVGDAVGALTYLLGGVGYGLFLASDMVKNVIDVEVRFARLRERMTPPPIVAAPEERGDREVAAGAAVVLRGLTFAYGPDSLPIVTNLDLALLPGDHMAVVGPSGIGKSTLGALLAGVLAPQQGTVLVDGQPIAGLARPQDAVTYVPQEAYVFSGTLRENLLYLAPEASEERVRRAARAVGLGRVIERLGGLDAAIEPVRSGLSEGERQLIVLTRAYLSSAPIVVLDEASCYLDPAAEDRAERAFMATGRTLIVIAHRMSATLRARRVLVMDGERCQVGSHQDLLLVNDLYADLHGHWREDL